MVEETSILYRNPDLLMNTVNGETVMMSIERGNYYGMNATGNLIWSLLEEEKTVDDIVIFLKNKFSLKEETVQKEVYPFLNQLVSEEIVKIK